MSILLCICLGLLALYFFLRPKNKAGIIPPGPHGWPLVGIGCELKESNIHEKFYVYSEQYGDIFKTNIFGTKFVVLNTPDLIKKAFNDDPYKVHMNDRPTTFFGEKVFYGSQGLGVIQRTFESPHGALRKEFVQAMNVHGEGKKEFEKKIKVAIRILMDDINSYHGQDFDFKDHVKQFLVNVIASMLGNNHIGDQEDFKLFWEFDEQVNFFFNVQVDGLMQAFPFLRYIPSVYKQRYDDLMVVKRTILQKYFYDMKASYKAGKRRGIIDYFIEEQQKSLQNGEDVLLTDERIHCLLLETIIAGMLTSVSTISSLFLCLINHPEYQKKIHEELDSVVGRDRLPTLADKPNCPFIEAVVMETLRLIPVSAFLFPHLCRPNINFEGYDIEENSTIIPNAWYVLHDEKIWGDPWKFRPERFLDKEGHILPIDHPYRQSWIPFSTGKRHCLGESFARSRIFLVTASLLQRWTFTMDPEKIVSCDPRSESFSFNLMCTPNHYKCKVIPRI